MSVRDSFVQKFGEDEARRLEDAASEHKNGVHDWTGSDPFKWVLVICIGYQCFEKPSYRTYHKIEAPYEEIRQWIKSDGHLDTHDGDCDFLSLFVGAYNDFMPEKAV